jgi:hypothetical protein
MERNHDLKHKVVTFLSRQEEMQGDKGRIRKNKETVK